MRSKYPQFSVSKNKTGQVIFRGKLQVKPELPEYSIRIVYRGGRPPQVFIDSPEIVSGAPHIYSDTKSLCLYHADNFRWQVGKLIANEIMGWTAGWIYFYEYWLQYGEWIGPEVPHNWSETSQD